MCAPAIPAFALPADDVKRIVARAFGVTVADLSDLKRTTHVSWARHVAVYLVRETLVWSFPRTAIAFHRHHATVIHSCNAVRARRAREPQFGALVERLKRECGHVSGSAVGLRR